MKATTEQYARARIAAINDLMQIDHEDNGGDCLRLLKSGFVPERYIEQLNKLIEQRVDEQSKSPLEDIEKTSSNTWFAIHPEKVAGVMEQTSSLMFPLRCNGTRSQIVDMFNKARATFRGSQSKQPNNIDRERAIRLAKSKAKALKLKAQAIRMREEDTK